MTVNYLCDGEYEVYVDKQHFQITKEQVVQLVAEMYVQGEEFEAEDFEQFSFVSLLNSKRKEENNDQV